MPKMMLAANVGGKTRRAKMDGEEYLVAPVGMLAVGVWKGSAGAALYRRKALENSVPTWDHKPVVVYHPKDADGEMDDACRPETITKSRVGIILNTRFDDKLKSEAWLNISKCERVVPGLIRKLERGTKVETSTGIVYKMMNHAGRFRGAKFDFEIKEMVGNHLAILPDEEGAYPVSAGGGLLANKAAPTLTKRMAKTGVAMPDGTVPICSAADLKAAVAGFRRAENKTALKAHIKGRAKALGLAPMLPDKWSGTPAANELSGTDLGYQLREALGAKYGQKGKYWSGYVSEIYPESKYVIYYGDDGMCYKTDYTTDGDVVALRGDAVSVTPKRVYQTEAGDYVGNGSGASAPKQKERVMANGTAFDARAHAKKLIVNGVYKKEDFKMLLQTPPEILQKIPVEGTKRKAAGNSSTADTRAEGETTAEAKRSDFKEVLANASPEDRAAIEYGKKRYTKDKESFIKQILANEDNTLDEEDLRGITDISMLEGMARLANSTKAKAKAKSGPVDDDDDDDDGEGADYGGAAGSAPVLGNEGEVEVLLAPDYDLVPAVEK